MQSVEVRGVTKGRDLDRFKNFEVYTAIAFHAGIYVYDGHITWRVSNTYRDYWSP